MDRDLHLRNGIILPAHGLRWRFTPSGGPGGQHANRSNTRAELSASIDDVRGASPEALARLRDRLGEEVTVTVDDTRSQHRNRELALERLEEKLRGALAVTPRRRPTRPSAGAKRRRLDAKARRSQLKQSRRRPDDT